MYVYVYVCIGSIGHIHGPLSYGIVAPSRALQEGCCGRPPAKAATAMSTQIGEPLSGHLKTRTPKDVDDVVVVSFSPAFCLSLSLSLVVFVSHCLLSFAWLKFPTKSRCKQESDTSGCRETRYAASCSHSNFAASYPEGPGTQMWCFKVPKGVVQSWV